jgi:hypothetical protein
MITHFIIPVHEASVFRLTDYATLFAHIPTKKFSVFWLTDFHKGKSKVKATRPRTISREDFETQLQDEAGRLKVEVNFIKSQSLLDTLDLSELLCGPVSLQPANRESLEQFQSVFSDQMLGSMNCSLFISCCTTNLFQEVIIVGDFDHSIVTAIKSLIFLFGKSCKEKKVTLFTPIPEDEMSIIFEQDLVSFIKESFPDVGIVPLKRTEMEKQIVSSASKMERPLLVLGSRNRNLLSGQLIKDQVIDKKLSLFYSN